MHKQVLTGFMLGLYSLVCMAENNVWIIAGGPNPSSSQAQIEYNVKWVLDSLNKSPEDYTTHVYFTHGGQDSEDIVEWRKDEDDASSMYVWSRIFGDYSKSRKFYRKNTLLKIDASTERDVLLSRLPKEFSALETPDVATIIYNGHGLRNEQDAGKNSLRLWNNSGVTAREFETLLGNIKPQVPVRFVFTQCYSGGFERLVHPNGDDVLALARGQRCGFFAESESEKAEGCSASIETGDYRDYTTYMFAALSGSDRAGSLIKDNVDLDHDGVLSLFDGHLYALSHAYNSDLPRSTSESFLEKWLPWYLRWLPAPLADENIYGELATALATQMDLPVERIAMLTALAKKKFALKALRNKLEDEQEENAALIGHLQRKIQNAVYMRWPAAKLKHTNRYLDFLQQDIQEAQAFITKQSGYIDLLTLQQRQLDIENVELLDVDREITQLNKLLRLRNLQRIRYLFSQYASQQEQRWYKQLRQCEALPL